MKRVYRDPKYIILVVLLLAHAIFSGWRLVDGPWNPLCDYPVQHVTNYTDGRLMVDPLDTVNVEAVKVNCDSVAVEVDIVYGWRSTDPRGTVVSQQAAATLVPGRNLLVYKNPIPLSVIGRSLAYKHQTGEDVKWEMFGSETPSNSDGKGVVAYWKTTPIALDLSGCDVEKMVCQK